MVRPLNSVARLSLAAPGKALKLPSTTTPLAWLARNPGCEPYTLLSASTICVVNVVSSARAAVAAIRSKTPDRIVADPRLALELRAMRAGTFVWAAFSVREFISGFLVRARWSGPDKRQQIV